VAKEEAKPAKDEDDEKDKKPAEGGEADGADDEKKSGSKKKLIIIAAAAALVLGAGGGGGFYFMKSKKPAEAEAAPAEGKTASGEAKDAPVFFPLGDLLVNLAGEGKHPNFLKVKVTLQLADPKDVPLMEAIKPRIIDNFQVYLRELRIEDLRGSAGMYRLREELLMRVTEAAQPVRVRDVLFQEMLVQ
jgi:flagellar FliL protein